MNTLPLLALGLALARPLPVPPPPEPEPAPLQTPDVSESEASWVHGPDLAFAALGAAIGTAAGLPFAMAVAALAPSVLEHDPILSAALLFVVPTPLLASAAVAASGYARDLSVGHSVGRVAFTAAGAGGGAIAGGIAGVLLGNNVSCAGWMCGVEYMVLGGLGGALVGGAVGSVGGLLVGDGLFSLGSRGRAEGEE